MTRPHVSFLLALCLCAVSCPAFAARTVLVWERMHTSAQPTRLFARLGLTHITRLGYTRDGAQKSNPDAQFPTGLTDVVPLDAEHVLLVRGTVVGRSAFRRRVAQMDVQMRLPRWHIEAFLQGAAAPSPAAADAPDTNSGKTDVGASPPDLTSQLPTLGEGNKLGEPSPSLAIDVADAPTILTVPDTAGTRTYQVDVNDVSGGSGDVLVTVRPNLAPPALPIAGLTLPAPPVVWGTPQTVRVHPGTPAVLTDRTAARDAARAKLRLPAPEVSEADIVLHVTVTPFVPLAPTPITPAPLAPPAPVAPAAP